MFGNRITKIIKQLAAWVRREQVGCHRIYDADMPEYAFAIDLYTAEDASRRWLVVQEYQAPADIPEDAVRRRRSEALAEASAEPVLQQVCRKIAADELQDSVPPHYAIYMFDPKAQTWLNVASPPAGFMYTDPVAIQPRAEPSLQPAEAPADQRLGEAETFGGAGEAPGVDDADEDLHVLETAHGAIAEAPRRRRSQRRLRPRCYSSGSRRGSSKQARAAPCRRGCR